MKKRVLVTGVIAGLISGAAFAQTNVVSSANVVGYNAITIPSNQYVLVALDFDTPNPTVSNLFATVPTGTEVTFWKTSIPGYVTVSKARTGWGAGGTNILEIGSGAFIKLPAAPTTNIYLSGDVPMAGTTVVYTVNGFKIVSYPYPADMAFTNTALAKTAATGDEVSFWNNGWTTYSKARTGWPAAITNLQLKVGQAFFLKAATNRVVNEVKPYTIE